jgi:hypothetical protein
LLVEVFDFLIKSSFFSVGKLALWRLTAMVYYMEEGYRVAGVETYFFILLEAVWEYSVLPATEVDEAACNV